MQQMNVIDFGSHISQIEKLSSYCKIATLLIVHEPESHHLRFTVVTHKDQCWTSKWVMRGWRKNRVPRCRFRIPFASQPICPWPPMFIFPPKICSTLHCLLQKTNKKEHNGVFWQQQPVSTPVFPEALLFAFWDAGSTNILLSHLK